LSALKILPLGGLGEIGMNCMILEYGDEILVVDCGIHFSDLDHFGVEFVIPDFTYLRERRDKVKAFVITHGHEDHIGALPFAFKSGVQAPIYCSGFTSLMIRERLKEYGMENSVEIHPFRMGDQIRFKHFKVGTLSVNHSIVDAAGLVIDTPVGRVVHTGDFKIDKTPFYGSEIDGRGFGRAGDEGVLLLMSDSTNVERHDPSMGERTVYNTFETLLGAAQGLTLISMFASNVARMGQVFELARKTNKKVALSGRSMEQNARLAQEAGYLKDAPSVLIPLDTIDEYARKDVVVLSTGSQGEYRSALIRVSNGEHSQIKLQKGDLVVMSSKFIPGNEKAIGRMINNLFKQGAEVLYEAVHDIHVSGHATRPELKTMLEWTRPRFFMPIHGEYRHLVHHAALARETGVKNENVLIAVNGDVMELTSESFAKVDQIEEPRVLVEGREGNDVSRLVLKERRQMGEKGIVFSLLVRNAESGRILSDPEIFAKGLAHESIESWLLDEAKGIVKKVVLDYERTRDERGPAFDLQETIRVELRRFFNQNIGKKPVVLPIVLDL
jgi:ribonuclease J